MKGRQPAQDKDVVLVRKEMKAAFRLFDTDKSGTIERHQLLQLFSRLTNTLDLEEPSEAEIREIFQELDTNEDGKISQEQFEKLILSVLNITKEQQQRK